ncbi:MAG: CAP domain-containing protein [Chloroflexota bacterium]|nr:CAP domain-containing protein [Chloroflexota bacterium]
MPPDASVTATLPSWLSELRLVDLIILAGLLLYGLDGMRRGFLAGALGLLGLFATLAVAVAATVPVSQLIRATLPALPFPNSLLRIAAFLVALAVAQVVFSILSRVILGLLGPLRRLLGPLAVVERVLGFVPGIAQGLIVAALILTPLRLFPIVQPLTRALDDSVIAQEIARRVGDWSPQFEALLQQVAGDSQGFPSRIIQPGENVSVPRIAQVEPDAEAEVRMLELVNGERLRAGLRPLMADERLRAVARHHSQEMFQLGYFAHVSPKDGTPIERLQRASIPFTAAGENLAYASTVEVAHSGLMASPGHRRNILTPEFTRVGMGVMRGGVHSRMFTQNFAS